LSLAHDKLQTDYEKLKAEEAAKSAKLAELSLQIDRREQAKQVTSDITRPTAALVPLHEKWVIAPWYPTAVLAWAVCGLSIVGLSQPVTHILLIGS